MQTIPNLALPLYSPGDEWEFNEWNLTCTSSGVPVQEEDPGSRWITSGPIVLDS